jgi:protein SCO1/2
LTRIKAVAAESRHDAGVKRVLLVALGLLAAPLATVAAERVFDVTGLVRSRLKGDRIVVTHDDIPGLMPAMTMAFTVANPAEAAPLEVGDRVRFQLRVTETTSRAENFVRLQGGANAAPTAAGVAGAVDPGSRRLRVGDRVPDFSLIDQDDRPMTAGALRGYVTALTFVFTRCPVPEYCPAVAMKFGAVQTLIAADAVLAPRARLLSVSIDPEFDRPDVLTAYAGGVGADPARWRFATGSRQDVDALARAFSVLVDRNGGVPEHTLCTALIDGDGTIVEIWRGSAWRPAEVIAAMQHAVRE